MIRMKSTMTGILCSACKILVHEREEWQLNFKLLKNKEKKINFSWKSWKSVVTQAQAPLEFHNSRNQITWHFLFIFEKAKQKTRNRNSSLSISRLLWMLTDILQIICHFSLINITFLIVVIIAIVSFLQSQVSTLYLAPKLCFNELFLGAIWSQLGLPVKGLIWVFSVLQSLSFF